MPAFLGPIVGLPLGVLFAWLVASDPEREEGRVAARNLSAVTAFAALVYAPVCAYFLLFAPDWTYAYLVPSAAVPSALELLLVAVDGASVVAGFALCRRWSSRGAVRPLLLLAFAPVGLVLVTVVALHHRLRVEGTFREFSASFGLEPLSGSPIGYALLWMAAMLAIGVMVTAREIAPVTGLRPRASPARYDRRPTDPFEGARATNPRPNPRPRSRSD